MATLSDNTKKLLEGKNFIFVGTVNPNGTPQVTPTWVDTDGKFILVNTAVGRVKYRNAKKNANVSLAIFEQSNPYNLAMIKGKVVDFVTGPTAEKHIDKLAKKYLGKDTYPNRRPGEQRVILKIEPLSIRGM